MAFMNFRFLPCEGRVDWQSGAAAESESLAGIQWTDLANYMDPLLNAFLGVNSV